MLQLIVENIRTFAERQTLPIAPLTILTGENSSGKTTFLASLAIVCDPSSFPFVPAFNRPPFQLGNYDTIATYKGGRYGRASHFTIGYIDDSPRRGVAASAEATFRGRAGQPELAKLKVSSGAGEVTLSVEPSSEAGFVGTIALRKGSTEDALPFEIPRLIGSGRALTLPDLLLSARTDDQADFRRRIEFLTQVEDVAYLFSPASCIPIAPIRTKPERTYGGITDSAEQSDDQVPFVLERLFRDESSKQTKQVLGALSRFGQESGLFTGVSVRKLGGKAGDPFQIMIKVGGRARNLIDVGYGVSQALPIIVQSSLAANAILLIQQPEVHLHPKAQAALGSFFSELTAQSGRRFVIETHSDFIIDRIRQRVAAKEIPPESVVILFFERDGLASRITPVRLDSNGNIIDAPSGYKAFFLEEELRLLNRSQQYVSNR